MNVLQAFSVYNKKVGYCQSMNFIVGFILQMSGGNEKDTFWLFSTLLQTYPLKNVTIDQSHEKTHKFEGLKGFYKKNFPTLMLYLELFDGLFKEQLPMLYIHFQNIGIPNMLWLHKWFQSFFLYSFPMGLCIRIWDNLLVFGTRYLFKATLAILKLLESELLKLDMQQVNDYFRAFRDEDKDTYSKLLPEIETIIKESYKVKINDQRLDELKLKFKQEQEPRPSVRQSRMELSRVNRDVLQQQQ